MDDVTTTYVWDGDQLVYESGSSTYKYIRGLTLIASVLGSTDTYYLHDGHGNVVALTNASGTVTRTYEYDAFGNQLNIDPADTNPFRYCGEYYDAETGNYYLRARYYDSSLGRFTQQDTHWNTGNMVYGDNPVAMSRGLIDLDVEYYLPSVNAVQQNGNFYTYCANNPIFYIDNNGELAIIAALAIGAGIGALINGGAQVVRNIINNTPWYNNLGQTLLAGGASGAISVIPIPGINVWLSVAITGAAGNLVGEFILGDITSMNDVKSALGVGAAMGIIGQSSAEILSAGFEDYFKTLTKTKQKAILNNIGNITNRELTEIRQAFKVGITTSKLDELVKEYGYDVIISAFVSSTTALTVDKEV